MPTTNIRDEFAPLLVAVVHDAGNAEDVTMDDFRRLVAPDELARHPESAPSSRERLIEQHARFRALLQAHGVEIFPPIPQPGALGQVFARDPCFAVGDTLFVGGLRDPWRHPETVGLRDIRTRFDRVVDLTGDGATIEGGDVMVLPGGKVVLVGTNEHTNEAGYRRLADALAATGREAVRVPHEALHLDCCLAPLPEDGEALYAAAKLPESSLAVLARQFKRLTRSMPTRRRITSRRTSSGSRRGTSFRTPRRRRRTPCCATGGTR